jgi:heptosyltransferase-1/heptosyltransferase-2
MILNSSLITSIKQTYPDAKISVLIRSLAIPIAEVICGIDEIFILHTPWLSREKNVSWIGVLKFCIKHFKSFDLVFEVHGEARNNFIAWMMGKFRVGTAIRGGGFFLNKRISWEREYDVHICDMQTRMLDAVTGIKNKTKQPNITVPESAKKSILNLLKNNALEIHGYVLIQMSTGGKNREWPLENWKILVEKLIASGNNVVCADLDKTKVSAVMPVSTQFYNINVSLIDYVELVRNAKAVISVETFCGHIASCFDVPTLSFYSGVTFWDEWRPKNNRIEYFQDTSCPKFPCGQHKCFFGYYSPCMKNISPDAAFDTFNKLLSRNNHSSKM